MHFHFIPFFNFHVLLGKKVSVKQCFFLFAQTSSTNIPPLHIPAFLPTFPPRCLLSLPLIPFLLRSIIMFISIMACQIAFEICFFSGTQQSVKPRVAWVARPRSYLSLPVSRNTHFSIIMEACFLNDKM